MVWKIVAIISVILLVLAVGFGIYIKMTEETESQSAERIINYTFEPRQTFFGCANYKIPPHTSNAEKN